MLADGSSAHHGLPIQHLIPIFAAVDQNEIVLGKFSGLHEREHFPKLVHGAESAGKNDERFGDLRKPKFSHEKIMEIKTELVADVGIRRLLVRQLDAQSDGFASGIGGAAICGFHNSRAAARTDDEAA